MTGSLTVPDSISFEAAITFTQTLLTHLDTGEVAEKEVQPLIEDLVQTMNGARGFFVAYLTDERPLADNPSPAVVAALKAHPEPVASLLIKNLAMSTAMSLAHQRQQAEDLAQSSQRVSQCSVTLIQRLALPEIQAEAEQLWQSLTTETGTYVDFLHRWGYDAAQKQQIQAALAQTFPAHFPTPE
ncbi:hypothetical protein GS597_09420 [Synechococcales cyanobacterium C]|uniref:Uncharacterized protein n=1 Tax=Petrachloros mirabilis ULC683 TaxID=2781853 RepID=A0A8K1ZZ16_9CYAN|nr:hypothetical protein [Petrachloros mirabilis]NCJ06721.1 hypothetical protein [Petrachloros mirabilis ULC683]